MKIIVRKDACPCSYCEHYVHVKDKRFYFEDNNGICIKHKVIRSVYENLCEDFVLRAGIHTKKWHPNKKELED